MRKRAVYIYKDGVFIRPVLLIRKISAAISVLRLIDNIITYTEPKKEIK